MSFSPIIVISGEPQSIFVEILLKSLKKFHNPIILISSKVMMLKSLKKFKIRLKLNELDKDFSNLKKKQINLININYNKFSFSKKKLQQNPTNL